jgi:hypothetical protein
MGRYYYNKKLLHFDPFKDPFSKNLCETVLENGFFCMAMTLTPWQLPHMIFFVGLAGS